MDREYNCRECGKYLSKIAMNQGGIQRLARFAAKSKSDWRIQKYLEEINDLKESIAEDKKRLSDHKSECKYQQRVY